MKFQCSKYSNKGIFLSGITLDSKIDRYEGEPIEDTDSARLYCYEYLTTKLESEDVCYWICYKK